MFSRLILIIIIIIGRVVEDHLFLSLSVLLLLMMTNKLFAHKHSVYMRNALIFKCAL